MFETYVTPHTTAATLKIPENILTELKTYVYCCTVEICGFIIGVPSGPGQYTATRLHLSRQVVHGTEADVEEHDTAKLSSALNKQFEDKMSKYFTDNSTLKDDIVFACSIYAQEDRKKERIVGQFHSHVHMPTFMSGGDEKTLKSLTEAYGTMIMLIFNKHDERNCWVSNSAGINVHKAPAELVVIEATGKPKSIKDSIENIKTCVFSADSYQVETKGPERGKIIERKVVTYAYNFGYTGAIRQPVGSFESRVNGFDNEDPDHDYWGGGSWQ